MNDILWGLQMMAVGMGVVFGLLLALMGVLLLIGRFDRPEAPEPLPPEPADADTEPAPAAVAVAEIPGVSMTGAEGLDADTVAAIAVAVMTHAENRRRLAAPEVRAVAPGSQLFASRWLSIGRGNQTQTFRRS